MRRLSNYEVTRRIEWDMAHRVPLHGGNCQHLHGHRYAAEITCRARELDERGVVVDFGLVKQLVGGWVDAHWDHNTCYASGDYYMEALDRAHVKAWRGEAPAREWYLLEKAPTAENLAEVLYGVAKSLLSEHNIRVVRVDVWETPNCRATYEPWHAEPEPDRLTYAERGPKPDWWDQPEKGLGPCPPAGEECRGRIGSVFANFVPGCLCPRCSWTHRYLSRKHIGIDVPEISSGGEDPHRASESKHRRVRHQEVAPCRESVVILDPSAAQRRERRMRRFLAWVTERRPDATKSILEGGYTTPEQAVISAATEGWLWPFGVNRHWSERSRGQIDLRDLAEEMLDSSDWTDLPWQREPDGTEGGS